MDKQGFEKCLFGSSRPAWLRFTLTVIKHNTANLTVAPLSNQPKLINVWLLDLLQMLSCVLLQYVSPVASPSTGAVLPG